MEKSKLQENIQETQLADALSERYLAYALSTIMSRSLPDVRDGLKPVHRRLLHAMRELKLDPKSGFKKCARVVGDVIGKYHPHGDTAVYDALVRLAQEFSQRYPLVDGQGNFGNIDGDNAAAMRYTEARLTEIAESLLEGIDEDTVDFRKTYDGEDSEPIVLPASVPNLLANGASGIAVGMAISIPPHNIEELIDALLHLIKFPNATTTKLVSFIKGPDFPTGGELVEGQDSIINSYQNGRGSFRLRAKWEKVDMGHGLYKLVITEIPYQVQKSKLIEKIAELIISKKIPLLADIIDESTDSVRIILEPKNRNIEPDILMEHLFQHTDLEVRIPLNMNVLDRNNTPKVMSVREILGAFLDHRHEILVRRSKFKLSKLRRRLEILRGFLIAYLNLDEVIKIIREEDDPKIFLTKKFNLSNLQVEAILNMRLRQLHKLEEVEINKENQSLEEEKKNIKELLNDDRKRWELIADQIKSLKTKFGQKTILGKRRTTIGVPPTAVIVPLEAKIEKESITIILSQKGWIRSIRGHIESQDSLKFKEGDFCKFMLHAETTDKIIIFATNGRCYTILGDKLPSGRGHGEPIRLMIDLENGHDVINIFAFKGNQSLIVASDSGRGFVVDEANVVAHTKTGKQILNLNSNEEAAVVSVISEDHDHLAVIGTQRKLLIFKLDEIPKLTRGRGVILQRYTKGILSDLTTFCISKGLSWETGSGTRVETNISKWIGRRAQAGQLPFKGFPKSNKFNRNRS